MAIDPLDLIASDHYGTKGIPHDTWAQLRKEPLQLVEPEGYESFWPITRHADITEISGQPELFCNGEGIVLLTEEQAKARDSANPIVQMKTIIEMDPPDHRVFRKVASGFFTPRGIESLDEIVTSTAKMVIDKLETSGEADFVEDIAQRHPLRVLCTILGVPPEDEDHLLELTSQLFAGDDEELQRPGEDRHKAMEELGMEFFTMFNAIIEDRRANPRDDLATTLALAKLENGEPMGMVETLGYYLIVFNAGHDTTRHALSGAFEAFLDNPDQFQRLKEDRELLKTAPDEIVRWVAPVNYMKRTVTRDTEFGGAELKKGDRLGLFYASANRDEAVFNNPDQFDVGRNPNRHLGFGWAEHYCLGAHLAKASITALLEQMVDRIDSMEWAGEPSQVASSFVVGRKHLPVRYELRA